MEERIDTLVVTGWDRHFRWHVDQLNVELRKGNIDLLHTDPRAGKGVFFSGILQVIRIIRLLVLE